MPINPYQIKGLPLGLGYQNKIYPVSSGRLIPSEIQGTLTYLTRVRAVVSSRGLNVAAMLYGQGQQGTIYPLSAWQSSLKDLDFDISSVLSTWSQNYGCNQARIAAIDEIPDSQQPSKNPLIGHIKSGWDERDMPDIHVSTIGDFNPLSALIKWQNLRRLGLIDPSEFSEYERYVERIKRLDIERLDLPVDIEALLMTFADAEFKGEWWRRYREISAGW
jgi:hypothetical protein